MTDHPASWVPYAQPLLDAVMLFDQLNIRYALIGGIAAMYYGRARFTEDVDFVTFTWQIDVVRANPSQMEKFHFDPACVYKLHHASGVQIDLWKDEHAEAIIRRSMEIKVNDRAVRIIEPHDLIAMKLRARRLKDDYDIGEITKSTVIDLQKLGALITEDQMNAFHEIVKRA